MIFFKRILKCSCLLIVLLLGSPDTYAAFKKAATENSAALPANKSLSAEKITTFVLLKSATTAQQQRKILRRVVWAGFKNAFHRAPNGGKSQLVALLRCLFFGPLGIHRFYLGYTFEGIMQLLIFISLPALFLFVFFPVFITASTATFTISLFPLFAFFAYGAWILIDFIRILTGSLQPKNGVYEETL